MRWHWYNFHSRKVIRFVLGGDETSTVVRTRVFPIAVFRSLFTNSNEREYFDSVAKRPAITDDEFRAKHYRGTDVTLDTCVRVRRVLCEQLRMCNTRPHDNVAVAYDDIDIAEVCFEIAEEFGVTLSAADLRGIDGTVDSLIRLTQRKLLA